MDESFISRILSKMALAIIVVAVADLLFLNYLVIKGQRQALPANDSAGSETREAERKLEVITPSPSDLGSPSPPVEPRTEIKTVETKTIVEKEAQTIVQTAQKEIFIPMGSGATKSREFADLTSTDVKIDTSKYSNVESVVFEASIWVEGGNGAAYAQLYNVEDKTGYFESQISNNTGSAAYKTSGKLQLPNGQKTYRVRAKTDIVEFAAHVENARIKITLK
ncbi:hypothetical protein HYU92_01195 [Candidatus Curtissbacteria bacterium]|nr:hypothetical protein [Candidatus Curtissbacteria bacterium]